MKSLTLLAFIAFATSCQTARKEECSEKYIELEKACQELYMSYLWLFSTCVADIPTSDEI